MPCTYCTLYKTLESWTHANSKWLPFWLRWAIDRDAAQFPHLQNIMVLGNNSVTWMRKHTWYYFLSKWLVWISTQEFQVRISIKLPDKLNWSCCYFYFGQDPVSEIPELRFLLVPYQLLTNILLGILNQGATWSFDPNCFTPLQQCHNINRVPTICDHLGTRQLYLLVSLAKRQVPQPSILFSPLSLYCATCSLIMLSFLISTSQLDSSCQCRKTR